MEYGLKLPGKVIGGPGALKGLTEIITGMKHVVVMADRGVAGAGLLAEVLAMIEKSGATYQLATDLASEPSVQQIQAVIDRYGGKGEELVIAVGGGSVMDCAKLFSVADSKEVTVTKLLDNPGAAVKRVKTVMIPTTAGTGSEATPNSIVRIEEKDLKAGIVSEAMIADYVILDPQMTRSMPQAVAASTGIDALAHAIECYTSNKANLLSDLFAMEAMELIFQNIQEACGPKQEEERENQKMEARNKMLSAAFYGGLAISSSGTTAVHALSYPLGGKYHIPHGIANAILLVPVMKFNRPSCEKQLAKIYDRLVLDHGAGNQQEKADWVIRWLEETVTNLGITRRLRDYGIGEDEIESLVKAGMEVTRLLENNRRKVTEKDARNIYLEVL